MSFAKAVDLMILANAAAANSEGIGLDWIAERFNVSHRTAQRMTQALESIFQDVEVVDGSDRRRRWRIVAPTPFALQGHASESIAALDIAIDAARKEGSSHDQAALENLRNTLISHQPKGATRVDTGLAESPSVLVNSGPRVILDAAILATLKRAAHARKQLAIVYGDSGKERLVSPFGLNFGQRAVLVAEEKNKAVRGFWIDKIRSAQVLEESFEADPYFTMAHYAAGAFGTYHAPEEYGEVVWKFAPAAAERAGQFVFHPHQVSERLEDGSLVVRFWASGHLEMAWHLYQWGDKVEVIAPKALRKLIKKHRRDDFTALP